MRCIIYFRILIASTLLALSAAGYSQTIDSKAPIPELAEQQRVRGVFKEVFGKEYGEATTQAKKVALATKLKEQTGQSKPGSTELFVLLNIIHDISAQGGDAELALGAIDTLAESWDVNRAKMKSETLVILADNVHGATQFKKLTRAGMVVVDEIIQFDNLSLAKSCAECNVATAQKSIDPALVKTAQNQMDELDAIVQQQERIQEDLKKLSLVHDDPEASLHVGRYYCFGLRNWDRGIPLLAKSNDAELKELANREGVSEKTPEDKLFLGDGWWDLGQKSQDRAKTSCWQRSAFWYQQVSSGASGLAKERIEKRLAQIAPSNMAKPTAVTLADKTAKPSASALANKNKIAVFDAQNAQLIRKFVAHPNTYGVSFSPDGLILASCGHEPFAKMWNPLTGELQGKLDTKVGGIIFGVQYSPDGKAMVLASERNVAVIWGKGSATASQVKGHEGSVTVAIFSPVGSLLATGSVDSTVRLWDQGGRMVSNLTGHSARINSLVFARDGKMLASASDDHSVKLWNVTKGQLLKSLSGHDTPVRSVAFSLDGATVASASDDGLIKLWNPQTGNALHSWAAHRGVVRQIAFSPDGSLLASAGDDQVVKFWNVNDQSLVAELKDEQQRVNAIAFSPNGKLFAAGDQGGNVLVFDGTPEKK